MLVLASAMRRHCRSSETDLPRRPGDTLSAIEGLAFEALVEIGDLGRIAVEELRRAALARAEQLFRGLAPARMRDLRIHIGPEAVFLRLDLLPEALRALLDEAEADDRLDRLEAVFPGHGETNRRAHRLGQGLAVGARDHEGEVVRGLGERQALDIGPGIPALPLAGRDLRVQERLHPYVSG